MAMAILGSSEVYAWVGVFALVQARIRKYENPKILLVVQLVAKCEKSEIILRCQGLQSAKI